MEEKNYEMVKNLEQFVKKQIDEQAKPWDEMVKRRIILPATVEAPRLSLLDRIGLWVQRGIRKTNHASQRHDLSDLLFQVRCKFLTLLRSTSTYYIFLPEEIEIRETHRSPSKVSSVGIVEVYRQGQLAIQSQWSLSQSGDELNFEVTCPLAVFRQLVDLAWRNYPPDLI